MKKIVFIFFTSLLYCSHVNAMGTPSIYSGRAIPATNCIIAIASFDPIYDLSGNPPTYFTMWLKGKDFSGNWITNRQRANGGNGEVWAPFKDIHGNDSGDFTNRSISVRAHWDVIHPETGEVIPGTGEVVWTESMPVDIDCE